MWETIIIIIEANDGQFIANNFSISQMFYIDRKLELVLWSTEITEIIYRMKVSKVYVALNA